MGLGGTREVKEVVLLQLNRFYEQCYSDFNRTYILGSAYLEPRSAEDVRDLSRKLFQEIELKQVALARKNPAHLLDRWIWTKQREHIDDPEFDVAMKKKIILGLHIKNTIFGTYNKTVQILRPIIEEINKTEMRPARILEVAGGVGKNTIALYEKFKNKQLHVELTGSDIVPEYIQAAQKEVAQKGYPIDFRILDACHLELLDSDSYDIVFTLHSLHHFLPEDLAMMMAGSQKMGAKAFVGIDGFRGLGNLLFMVVTAAGASLVNLDFSFLHDALISGRRMYSAKQLELLARVGCPGARVIAENHLPGLSVIQIMA